MGRMFTLDSLNPAHFWHQLPMLSRFFLVFLCVETIRILALLMGILFQLRSLRKLPSTEITAESMRSRFAKLRQQTASLRQSRAALPTRKESTKWRKD